MKQEVINWFNKHGFDHENVNQKNSDNEYALILASRHAKYNVLAYLIAHQVDINCLDNYGNNALWAACYANSEKCSRLLVENGCDLNYQNTTGNTALSYAASCGKDAIVELLLKLGANSTLQNQDDMTAIDLVTSFISLKLLRNANA